MGAPDAVPAQGRSAAPIAPLAVTAAVAVVTFLLAYDGGTFGDTSRQTLAVAVWWVVILAGVAGLWPLAGFNRTTLLAGGFLAAYAGLTLASVIWADSAEDAFSEFNRVALYLGVFALAALAVRRGLIPLWTDGFALGIVAVAGLAFFSRCFPDLIAPENLLGFRLDLTRLSYPLGYWNGLAIFAALAVPFLLRLAVSAAPLAVRAVALAPFPMLGAVLYLTSSRGGLGTAVIGTLALYALVPRTRTVEAILIAAAGAAGGIACVVDRDQLVNHPGPTAAGQGHVAFPIVIGVCVATAAVAFLVFRFLAGPLERRTARVGRMWRALAAAVVVLVVAAGVVAAHPVRLFEHFKAPPPTPLNTLPAKQNPIEAHILSTGSSGRWQQWGSAIERVRKCARPGEGRRLVRGVVGAARHAAGVRQGRALALPRVAGRARHRRIPVDRGRDPHRHRRGVAPGALSRGRGAVGDRGRLGRARWVCLRRGDRLDVGDDRRLRRRVRPARGGDVLRRREWRRRSRSGAAGTSPDASSSASPVCS